MEAWGNVGVLTGLAVANLFWTCEHVETSTDFASDPEEHTQYFMHAPMPGCGSSFSSLLIAQALLFVVKVNEWSSYAV